MIPLETPTINSNSKIIIFLFHIIFALFCTLYCLLYFWLTYMTFSKKFMFRMLIVSIHVYCLHLYYIHIYQITYASVKQDSKPLSPIYLNVCYL